MVLLTRVSGWVFGNDDTWIDDAVERARRVVEYAGLDVRLVSRESVYPSFEQIARQW